MAVEHINQLLQEARDSMPKNLPGGVFENMAKAINLVIEAVQELSDDVGEADADLKGIFETGTRE